MFDLQEPILRSEIGRRHETDLRVALAADHDTLPDDHFVDHLGLGVDVGEAAEDHRLDVEVVVLSSFDGQCVADGVHGQHGGSFHSRGSITTPVPYACLSSTPLSCR